MIRTELTSWCDTELDLLVIGGGAVGLGVAVQAALEGRRVALVEARDFACGTSSRSTKLLHGGVRYLAQGRIKLVREALRERTTVLQLAPHLAQPLPFVIAESGWLAWCVGMVGLKLYQWLAGNKSLGPTTRVSASSMRRLLPSLPKRFAGIRFWDGQFDDARLALALARTAQTAGALLRNHTRVVAAVPQASGWAVELRDELSGERAQLRAACLVNATGVWVDAVRQQCLAASDPALRQPLLRPSQGVHLVVERDTLPLDEAVLVPHTVDGRVLFAVPWLGATVIGTTDTPRQDAPLEPRPTASELEFLFSETRRALGVQLTAADVKSVWVGLRPLVGGADAEANTSALSREHLILRDAPGFLTVTGGKWTTYRSMAEQVLQTAVDHGDLMPPLRPASTATHRLFGAPAAATCSLRAAPELHLLGQQAGLVASMPEHARKLGFGLSEAMVVYSARQEWAVTVEDMLARRWRVLFLDAAAAAAMAPRVAELLRQETGLDPQLDDFLDLCRQYRLVDEEIAG